MKHALRRSFRNRLFAAMLAGSLIPLLLCTFLMAHITRIRMDEAAVDDVRDQTEILLDSLNAISLRLGNAAETLRAAPAVRSALSGSRTNRLELNTLLYSATEDSRRFADFLLYDSQGSCLCSTQGDPVSATLPTNWGVLGSAAAAKGDPVYIAGDDPTDAASVLLTGAVQLGVHEEDTGFLVMQLRAAGFRDLLNGKYPQSEILILNRFFRPVFSSRADLITTLAPQLRQQLLHGSVPEDSYLYSVSLHEPTGLYLMLRQPRIFNQSTLRLFYTATLVCGLICVVVSVLISLPLSQQVSYPLRRLEQAFDHLQKDDLETQLPNCGEDELGRLVQRFNETVSALKVNRQELITNQKELDQAQIRMLQAQLNPHFLCNTLDTMKWIGKINKVPQVAVLSTDLSDILRFCISAEEFVPLYREMEILERYIEIQKLRLSDDFAFTTRINEELYDCMVPKMILQPLVENAILHGLGGREGSAITVTADFSRSGTFRIVVTDNGSGFPEQMLGRPYHGDKSLAKGHLGLYNVDTILRRYYGEECGLYLSAGENGTGAAVTVTLPVRYEEETEC